MYVLGYWIIIHGERPLTFISIKLRPLLKLMLLGTRFGFKMKRTSPSSFNRSFTVNDMHLLPEKNRLFEKYFCDWIRIWHLIRIQHERKAVPTRGGTVPVALEQVLNINFSWRNQIATDACMSETCFCDWIRIRTHTVRTDKRRLGGPRVWQQRRGTHAFCCWRSCSTLCVGSCACGSWW